MDLVKPIPHQVAWADMEFGVFCHFGIKGGHIPGVISAPVPEAKESIIPSKSPKCGAALKKAGEKGPATCPFCNAKVA